MSRNASVMGYIGVKSCKLSSIYADNYVVPDVIGASAATGDGTVTAHGVSGQINFTGMTTAAGAIEKFVVTNDVVRLTSKIFLSIRNVTAAAEVIHVSVSDVVQGAYTITVLNPTAATAIAADPIQVSYLIFNGAS